MKPVNGAKHQKTTPPTPRTRRRPPLRPANWDQQKAVALAKKGVSQKDIASVVGVSRHTVQAYLHRIRPEMAAPNATLRSQIVPGEVIPETDSANQDDDPPSTSPRARMSWAQLLTRVFAIDITACPQCGGELTLIAAIEDPAVIRKILTHLGLPTRAPPKAPARIDEFFQTA